MCVKPDMTYKKRMAWFSERWPRRMYALSAMSSAPPWALASRAPSAFGELDVYVLMEMSAWEDNRATGSETWKRLARCAVNCVSDWRWAGNEGREGCVWAPPPLPPPSGGRLRAMMPQGGRSRSRCDGQHANYPRCETSGWSIRETKKINKSTGRRRRVKILV